MELGTLVLLVLDAALITFFIVKGNQRARPWRELQAAYDAYREALDRLAQHPDSAAHRRSAEELGRAYIVVLRRHEAEPAMNERVLQTHIESATVRARVAEV